jgi:hypothetical protein
MLERKDAVETRAFEEVIPNLLARQFVEAGS